MIKKRNQIIESLYSIPFEIIPDVYLNKIIRDKIWSRTYFLFIVLSFLIVCLNYFIFIRTSTSDPFIELPKAYHSQLNALKESNVIFIDPSWVLFCNTDNYTEDNAHVRFESDADSNVVGNQVDIGRNCCCSHF